MGRLLSVNLNQIVSIWWRNGSPAAMSIIIASSILLVIAAAYAVLLKRKLAETLFLAVATVVFVLFFFGMINLRGCLLWGVYFLVAGAFASLLYLIIQGVKNKAVLKEAELLPGLLLYALLLAFSLNVNVGRVFFRWDEFSHWGTVVKFFYSLDAFGTFAAPGISRLYFATYFPGTSLFNYFFSRFDSRFVEWYSYVAMNVLYFSLFMPLVKDIFKKKSWLKNTILLLVFLLMPLLMDAFYGSLYVDQILGAFFGFSLVYYFVFKYEKSAYSIYMVSAAAFMTTVTKDMGLLLALGAVAIIFMDIVLFRRDEIKGYLLSRSKLRAKVGATLLLTLPLFAILFAKGAWSLLLNSSGFSASGVWRRPSLGDIQALITRQVEPWQISTAWNWRREVFFRNIYPLPMSTFAFCVLFVLLVIAFAYIKKARVPVRRIVTGAIILAVGAGLYQVILMLMYVFAFDEREAVILASHYRYTLTYLFGMMLFLMVFFIIDDSPPERITFEQNPRKALLDVATYVLCLSLFLGLTLSARAGIERVFTGRTGPYGVHFEERETVAINKWKPYFEDARPYIIVQDDLGLMYGQLLYELSPLLDKANLGRDYLVATEANDYYHTMVVSPSEWQEYIISNGFELLYLYRSDADFVDSYGHFFPAGVMDDMLFRVTAEGGQMLLAPVE